MPLDLTDIRAQFGGMPVITAYGDGGFRIAEERYEGSILIAGGQVMPWTVDDIATVEAISLEPLFQINKNAEILLFGVGPSLVRPSVAVREAIKAHGLGLEIMDTGAACRTYNFLLAEGRRFCAALIAV